YGRGLHRFWVVLAGVTFLLLVAGALVTSNDAGLSVPDWPTSFGSLWRMPHMVGGVKYEHGHRMVAQFVGLLTILFAVWNSRSESRPWMRKLAWTALALLIAHSLLGGLRVKMFLPWYVSTAPATMAQAFFSISVVLALFTSRAWLEATPAPRIDHRVPGMRTLSILTTASILLQLILGAAFRHSGLR